MQTTLKDGFIIFAELKRLGVTSFLARLHALTLSSGVGFGVYCDGDYIIRLCLRGRDGCSGNIVLRRVVSRRCGDILDQGIL